jgi:hypothetical protein
MPMSRHRLSSWLAGVWTVFLVLLAGLFGIQGMGGKYHGEELKQALAWVIPLVTPGAAVTYTAALQAGSHGTETVGNRLAWSSIGLSAVYLTAVIAVPLYQPFSTRPPLAYMADAGILLGPCQVILLALLARGLGTAPSPQG